ncbi:nitric oxide reductase activation protein NorD [Inhella gelatinilytica]|uniref:VWA domain-containing protein n=1 Tax=Inhella gelatinilytica TaxID=2795030 RepID=A0A931ND12_9BURK|nr:VWA domain-containing protein [Inhella gelatinilytica]MBH9552109.1 VWA domain-containing protein [Inhella gelatinilytica]
MEEWIGAKWDRFVTRQASTESAAAAVSLASVQRSIELVLHAGGGHARLAAATPVRVGGQRGFWQRVAGAGQRAPLAQLDPEVLALPEQLAVHADPALNRDLYLWLAALAAHYELAAGLGWLAGNQVATRAALAAFPGLRAVFRRLVAAELQLRAQQPVEGAERVVQHALKAAAAGVDGTEEGEDGAGGTGEVDPLTVAPVWVWLRPALAGAGGEALPGHGEGEGPRTKLQHLPQRRRVQRQDGQEASRNPFLLGAKTEWIKTFADPFQIDRAQDDEDDGDADVAAEELETLTLQRPEGQRRAAQVRFDLDLPAASADDELVGEGEWLPEWDAKQQRLQPRRVLAQCYMPRNPSLWTPDAALRVQAAQVRRRMELQQAAPRWLRAQREGEQIDLDAWVRHRAHPVGTAAVYERRVRAQRELASLLLADLSLSTDAHANNEQRVIEVIRDALYTFGEALAGSGDAFAMLGFSSVRRQLRLHELKGFDERWSDPVRARLGALKPGYYTRMGAALRAATRRLEARPERQRLLILLTDGKPHDLDGYEGRWGQDDTRQAVQEARAAGLLPFAVSIDETAPEVLPALFGDKAWAWVRRPEDLPLRLAALYGQLTR